MFHRQLLVIPRNHHGASYLHWNGGLSDVWGGGSNPANIDGPVHEVGRHGNRRNGGMYNGQRNGVIRDHGSDSGSDGGGQGGLLSGESDDESDDAMRMREEIQQYQEALAEASKTIELLRNKSEIATASALEEDDGLLDTVKMYEKRTSRIQDELQTEVRIRGRVELQLEKANLEISTLQEANEKLKTFTASMQSESDRIRKEVAISEATINAQLKGAAIQMKQTLKQCHMLEELVRPEITCNNCFDILEAAQILYPCGHSFCDKCVDEMERPEDGMVVCQVCQSLTPRADTCPNISLQAICPRVAWWAEPISALKDMFNGFSGKEFVAQQTFTGSVMDNINIIESATRNNVPVSDARTTKVLVRIAGAVKETGKSVVTLFEEFDDDHGGTVDYEELKNGLEGINLFLPPKDFDALLAYADPNGDGEIESSELTKLTDFTEPIAEPTAEGEMHRHHELSLSGVQLKELMVLGSKVCQGVADITPFMIYEMGVPMSDAE